jgi:hypothetical protein
MNNTKDFLQRDNESPMYEYESRLIPYSTEAISTSFDSEMNNIGYHRVWADITMNSIFIVYRKEVNR